MNFKFTLTLFVFVFVTSGCGVKGDPLIPKPNQTPSLLNNYPDIKTEAPLEDAKKNRK